MKKNRKRLSVMRLEERVLFDAAAVAAAAEAAQQEQENQDLQQQQQDLQEQMAEEAAQQQAQEAQQAAGVDSQTPAADADADAESEAPAADDAAAAQGGEAAQGESAGSEVADAVESIAADDGVEGADLADLPGSEAGADVVGDTLEGLNQDQTDAQEPAAADTAAVAQTDADADSDTDGDTDAAETAAAYAPDAEETPEAPEHHELAIISGTVPDAQLIIDSLDEGTDVLVLNSDSDVLDQINEYLDASAVKYDAIHIVSHGGNGFFTLNGVMIDMQALQDDPASWAAIGEHLTADGDILLYGCNIAAHEDGKAFASQLASLTGADVAASVTPTGHSGWELEYMTGSIATPVLNVDSYDADLATYIVVGDNGTRDKAYQTSDSAQFTFQAETGHLIKRTKVNEVWTIDTTFLGGNLQWCLTRGNVTEITSGTTESVGLTLTFDASKPTYNDNTSDPQIISSTSSISVSTLGIALSAGDDNVRFENQPDIDFDGGTFSITTTGYVTDNQGLGDVTVSYRGGTFTVNDISQYQERNYNSLTITGKGTFNLNDSRWAVIGNLSMGGSGTLKATSDVTILGIGGQDLKKDSINSTGTFEYKVNGYGADVPLWGGSYNILVLSGSGTASDTAYSYTVKRSEEASSISASQVNDDGVVYSDGAGGKSHLNLKLGQVITGAKFGQNWAAYNEGEVLAQGLNVTYTSSVKSTVDINSGNYHDLTLYGTNLSHPEFARNISSAVNVAGTLTVDETVRYLNVSGNLMTYKVEDTLNTVWNVTGNWTFRRIYNGADAGQEVDWQGLNLIDHGEANGYYGETDIHKADPEDNPDPGFTVTGAILNTGKMYFEQLGYRFMNVENSGTIETSYQLDAKENADTGAAGRWVSFAHLDNKENATLDFNQPVRLEEMLYDPAAGRVKGWTNYGTLNVRYNYFGYDADTPLKVTNYTKATMTFSNLQVVTPFFTDYVFDNRPDGQRADGVQQVFLVNGGTIHASMSGRVVFVAFEELSGAQEKAVYSVGGTDDQLHLAGAMYFELAHTIDAGIYGSIQVRGGTVNFNTEGQQYHGGIIINSVLKSGKPIEYGTANINQRSVFNGSISGDNYAVINIGTEGTHDGNTLDPADTNKFHFDNAVINRYYFADDARSRIAWHSNNLRTLAHDSSDPGVQHDWKDFSLGNTYIGVGAAEANHWKGSLSDPRAAQFSDANGTIFSGAVASHGILNLNADSVTFEKTLAVYHDFTIAGNKAEFKGAVTVNQGTLRNTIFTYANEDVTGTVFKDAVKINGGDGYTALFYVNALTEFQGSLTNNDGGIVVSRDGNTFHEIINTGSHAEFYMNSTGNYLDHEVKNQSGATFTLNNVNIFTKFTNDARLIVNQEASTASDRSSFITLTNSGTAYFRGSFDIENEYKNSGTTFQQWGDIDYKGGINNSGEFLLTNTGEDFFDGRYVFNSAVTNSGTFKVSSALAEFKKGITNTGKFLVSSRLEDRYTTITDGFANIFSQFTNSGSSALLTVDSAGNYFKGAITNNSGLITFGDVNTIAGAITNTGTLQINASVELTDVTNNGGTINLQGAPQVVISVLSMTGGHIEIDADSALHLHTVTDDAESSFMVMGRYRHGVYGDHVTPDVSDSTHGLFFENTADVQTILSTVEYQADTFEEAVWFDPSFTVISTEESTWIIIGNVSGAQHKTLTLTRDNVLADAKYKVVNGGTLTVDYAMADTLFNVSGGRLVFSNDSEALTVNHQLNIASGSVTLSGAAGVTFRYLVSNAGDMVINTGSVNFAGNLDNFGTVTAKAGVAGIVNNYGNYVLSTAGLILGGSFNNNAEGTLTVAADGTISGINTLAGSTIDVQSGKTLTVDQTAVGSDLVNSGAVKLNGDVAFSGNVTGNGGAFTGANGSEKLEFSGTSEGSGVFDSLAAVRYTGTNETNILTGTYGNLELADAVKIVDNGVVQVDGTFTDNGGVRITPTGELRLKGAAAGAGDVTNAGTFNVDGKATISNHVDNSGTVDVNGMATLTDVTNSKGGEINMAGIGSTVSLDDNAGTVNLSGNSVTANVTGTNSGKVLIAGNNAVVDVANNAGTIAVSGGNAALTGLNAAAGNVTVTDGGSATTTMTDVAGSTYKVESGAALTLGNNGGTYNGSFQNDGTVVVDAKADFTGTVSGSQGSDIIVTEKAAGIDAAPFLTPSNKGALELDGWSDLKGKSISNNVQVNYGLSSADLTGTTIDKGGVLGINANSTLSTAPVNNGTIQVGAGAALTYTTPADTTISGNYEIAGKMEAANDTKFAGSVSVTETGAVIGDGDLKFARAVDNAGSISAAGDATFSGSVNNSGTVGSTAGVTTFKGATSGDGSVNGKAVYDGKATSVYGGNYTDLTVKTQAALAEGVQAKVSGDMNLVGSLSTGSGSTLTLNGTTSGDGAMKGGSGTVVYNGAASNQSIYAGQYDNLTIGSNAKGDFDTNGNVSISGDAVDKSSKGGIAVTDSTVTYNGTGTQKVMAGSYDKVVMAGSGTKVMDTNGAITANNFVSDGSPENRLTLVPASGASQWTLDAENVSIHYSNVYSANSTNEIFLDGTNQTGGSVSGSWMVFDAAGGIGDSYPGEGNRNFNALAFYSDRLSVAPTEDIFAFAHRLPGGQRPIAVGESVRSEPLIGGYNSYDLINFGNGDGIRLLDEESREVLSDASAAGSSDLVELLEEK